MRNNIITWVALLVVIFLVNPVSALEATDLEYPCDTLFPKAVSFSEVQGDHPHYEVYEDINGANEIIGICYITPAPFFGSDVGIMVGLD
ncbi:hypothetical protein GOV14_06580, partial [Candidatus Pacearchaeota archaeon]|nr:hypothetical protein [Candidatus Pacearchaeota archaeon]